MNILLLSMPNAIAELDRGGSFPNLGLASLAGNVDKRHTVKIADLVLCRANIRRYITELIKDYSPDIVGFSSFSFQFHTALNIAKIIKQLNESIFTVFGGYHPTLKYEDIQSEEDPTRIDFIIRNEGEFAFRKLIDTLEKGEDYSTIAGLSFKVDGEFQHNEPTGVLNLDHIQLPDRSVRILEGYRAWGLPCDVVETSRGCTLDCKFCTITKMYGRTFRTYPLERIVRDIKDASTRGAKIIFFVDDNITLNMHHLEEVCDAIIAARLNKIHYIIQASVQGISSSKKVVDKMAKAGFKTVFLGIENVSSINLEFLGKDNQVNNEKTERAVAYLRENNIIVLGATIVGNRDDDEKAMWQNFFYLKKLKIDGPLFFTPTPLPKTKLREEMLKEGLVINPSDYTWYTGTKTNVRTKYLEPHQIDRTILEMYVKFLDFNYFRYSRIRRIYPRYFYRQVLKEAADTLLKKLAFGTGSHGQDPLGIATQSENKRREKWLLEDVNRSCTCPNCTFARQTVTRGFVG